MTISNLKPGDVLWDAHSYRMGNTSMRSVGVWPVRILEVDPDGKWVKVSWNENFPEKHYSLPRSWKSKQPKLISMGFGRYRLATKAEILKEQG